MINCLCCKKPISKARALGVCKKCYRWLRRHPKEWSIFKEARQKEKQEKTLAKELEREARRQERLLDPKEKERLREQGLMLFKKTQQEKYLKAAKKFKTWVGKQMSKKAKTKTIDSLTQNSWKKKCKYCGDFVLNTKWRDHIYSCKDRA